MSLGIPEVGAFGLDRLEDSIAKWEAGNKNNRGGGGAASSLLQSQQGPGEGESIGTRHQAPPPLDPGAPRRMVHIDSQGRPSVVSVGKHTLVAELGIPYRDLRILDPWVYVLSIQYQNDTYETVEEPQLTSSLIKGLCQMLGHHDHSTDDKSFIDGRLAVDWNLPYELRAFETALAEGVRVLDSQVDCLEEAAFPTLEALATKVSGKQLEKVREMKRIMSRLMHKVSKLKKALEKLLDDDLDMMDMYLGKRADREASTPGSEIEYDDEIRSRIATGVTKSDGGQHGLAFSVDDGIDSKSLVDSSDTSVASERLGLAGAKVDTVRSHSTPQVDKADRVGTRLRRMSPATSLHSSLPGTPRSPRPDSSTGLNASAEETTAETNLALYKMLSGTFNPLQDKRKSHLGWEITTSEVKPGTLHDFRTLSRTITHVDPREVEGVEALLEAYFMQIEFTLGRLLQLKERIDDTEDLVVMDLDHRRNELHGLEVLVTSITLAIAFVSMVAAIFGMNLKSGWESHYSAFISVTWGSIVGAVVIIAGLIYYLRSRRLMFIPDTASIRPVATPGMRRPSRQSMLMEF